MEFEDVTRNDDLPRLAWALSLKDHHLTVGSDVDVTGGECFEGARTSRNLLGDGYVFGSGVVRHGREYTCVPPTHTLDGLYVVVRHLGGATVTNSLVWALRIAGVTAANAALFNRMITAVRTSTTGIVGYQRMIYTNTARGVSVFRMLYWPFTISNDGYAERPVAFPEPTELDFETYKSDLIDGVRRTLNHSPRFTRLVSTCSSGYDSAACTAIGKEVGLEIALTVRTGRGDRHDSGERPAREMGVPVRTYDRPGNGHEQYREDVKDWFVDLRTVTQSTGQDFSEFLATFVNDGDVYFKPFEEHLRGAVLLTGFLGQLWDYGTVTGPWVNRDDTSGAGLNEYRLRVGFVHLPVPYIGALQAPAIKRVSQSPSMRPWRHGGEYNRPIPRRLAEEAGASRESFGVKKMAANVMIVANREDKAEAYERVAARYG